MNNENISATEHPNPPRNRRILTVNFFGTPIITTVTSTPSVVRKWISTTMHINRYPDHHLVVGLGVQWRPTGTNDPADTLQLCVGRHCLIFQLTHAVSVPRVLRRFLLDPKILFVGICNYLDKNKLQRSNHRLFVPITIDLRHYLANKMGDLELKKASMATMVRVVLGFEGVKNVISISKSDWSVDRLSHAQVINACIIAYVSFEIGTKLQVWEILW